MHKQIGECVETEQDKRDRLIAEWILRIATIEKVLISKGIITIDEISAEYVNSISKMKEFMNNNIRKDDSQN
ncbi:MAG: hypothetical protein Q8P20_00560 [bacterium]|nr:hypothetical protein [bacterium]